ncbi:HAD-IA family hydrolase [Nitriliruptor alkaliphilus]|uniref:HAD-IA family hydrolase n=1 Tax=Nitriliruptor alkaliphilus TaxID=427918 RepID=UPI000698B24B|nr:HAD-IA family hydrolase [Nitriliruptor alkaliphilus]
MRVRVVLFDVMDTVLVDPFREALRACTPLPLRELFARRGEDLWPAFERGDVDEAAYWAGWDAAGLTYDRDAFHAARRAGTRWVDGMPELLDDLGGLVERVTASNYPVWIEELASEHLTGRFERVLASHHLGVRKPDPAFFARLLDRIGAAADEAAFVDDREVNVAAAEEVGLTSHRFEDAASLRAWLVDLGVPLERAA